MAIPVIPSTGDWPKDFESMCARQFGVSPLFFLEAILRSPNARGYILGPISELQLFLELLTDLGYHVLRIKEKWTGRKLHYGDLYLSVFVRIGRYHGLATKDFVAFRKMVLKP